MFAVYDLQHDPTQTVIYAALEDSELKGYILIYTALQFPSVILEDQKDLARQLLGHAPENRFILHAPPQILPIIRDKFKDAKTYVENWMLVKKEQANFFRSNIVGDCILKLMPKNFSLFFQAVKTKELGV